MSSSNQNNANDEALALTNADDDDTNMDPAELIRDFSTHPLMKRAQIALNEQLKETQYRLQVELLDKDVELKGFTKDREVVGNQLYNLQQQLARAQITLEGSGSEYSNLVEVRLQQENMLREINKSNAEQQAMLNEHKKQHTKYINELEALNETIRQIEKYNEEMKSEIAITRRATYKTEQSMQELEKRRENQDFYVDNLNKQIRVLNEQIALHTTQLDSQKNETSDASALLQDTARELQLIENEKKQLMVQWKSALTGLSRRDEALAQGQATLASAENAVHDYDVIIETSKREIQQAQAKHESLVNLRDRLENELQWVEETLTKIRTERDQLQERYMLLSKSLQQTDAEAKKLDLIAKQLGSDADALLSALQIVTQERQKLEEEINTSQSTHSNVNKAILNLRKSQMKVLKTKHERENEAREIENEIARTKVDRLNINSMIDQLREQHGGAMKEIADKESMIAKYQLEIRQRNDEIEKKMYRVDRLNKKYEKMIESAGGEENLGPLENTIKQLNKETDAMLEECKEMEREWLKKQTDLVQVTADNDSLTEANNEYQARVTILSQQQLRLSKDSRLVKTEVKVANQSNIDLQKDVAKLNILISANHEEEGNLQTSNFIIEKDCVEELKQMERDSIGIQASIVQTKTAKAKLTDEILEMERQALLWEKKIQLDKETREALDPTVGQQETQTMEREIHRMELRLQALKREEERLSGEMERAIHKRAAISNRYSKASAPPPGPASASKGPPVAELTQATSKKRIANLKKDSRTLLEETSLYNQQIEERKAQLHEMASELERMTSQYGEMEELNHSIQGEINDILYQKQLNQERVSYRQKFAKRLKEISQVGIDNAQSLQIERRLLSASQALENVKEIISDLQGNHPHLNNVLSRVYEMTDPSINFAY